MAIEDFALVCPAPRGADETIQVAHGGGGRATERLLETIFRPAFADPELDRRHDGARLELSGPTAFTTDSYVVRPLEFPGRRYRVARRQRHGQRPRHVRRAAGISQRRFHP